ncbi:MAG: GlcNAc-PI de-N-acetylase [Chloroflexia bacterium]|nr:GlcNAc-PI de-N-acetylase [Chloroflexia bacterium]
MIFHSLNELSHTYDHVYLSPHLDDAALSCGGAIAAQQRAGQRVLVVTLCTATPSPEGPFSELAQAFHSAWGLGPAEVVATRLCEDEAALALLGADGLWAGCLDAIYRHPMAYTSRTTLFHQPAADDPLHAELATLLSTLCERLPEATFYAPLGVGAHVDHLLTYAAARAMLGSALACYEDLPYVIRPGALAERLAKIDITLKQQMRTISATLDTKRAAIAAYTSQMVELAQSHLRFTGGDVADASAVLAAAVAAYAHQVGGMLPAERIWV